MGAVPPGLGWFFSPAIPRLAPWAKNLAARCASKNETLRAARDLLLPGLMSGEITL